MRFVAFIIGQVSLTALCLWSQVSVAMTVALIAITQLGYLLTQKLAQQRATDSPRDLDFVETPLQALATKIEKEVDKSPSVATLSRSAEEAISHPLEDQAEPLFQIEVLDQINKLKQIDRVARFYSRETGSLLVLTEFRDRGRLWLDTEDFGTQIETVFEYADIVFDTGFSCLQRASYQQRFLKKIDLARSRYDQVVCLVPEKHLKTVESLARTKSRIQYEVASLHQ